MKFTATDTDNIYEAAGWGYWGYAEQETFSTVGEEALRVSWQMHLNDSEDVEGYEPKTIDATALAKATQDLLDGKVKLGSHYREQLVRDLADWRKSPEYGAPFDADLAEIIVQAACFGEIVFG